MFSEARIQHTHVPLHFFVCEKVEFDVDARMSSRLVNIFFDKGDTRGDGLLPFF